MYCRGCGNQMPDSSVSCSKCGTRKGEGVKFCQTCGYHTTEQTEFCFNCGDKQRNIITQQMKNQKVIQLQKQAKTEKKFMKIERAIAIIGFLLAVVFVVIMVIRPQPEMTGTVPQPWLSNKVVYDYDVQVYWKESRELLLYAFMSLLMAVGSVISYFMQKSKYKKILKAIKEAKNVL